MPRARWLLLLASLISGCTALRPPMAIPAPSATPAAAVTASIPAPSTTTAPSPSPAPATISQSDDLSVYTAALRPEVAAGIELDGRTRYRLDVTLSADLGRVSGQEEIRYTNREPAPLDRVYLHLYPNLWDGGLVISEAQVAGEPVTVSYPSGDDVAGLPLDPPLAPGASVDLALRFEIAVPSGDGVGNYGEFALQAGILALAHFYPTVAVYDGDWRIETPSPQGDVIFHDASFYDVTLTGPSDLVVAATGATLAYKTNADDMATWRLAGGPLRDFNIAASRDYRTATTEAGDVIVTSYYLPEDEAGGMKALDWATDALRLYEQNFGPYPYRELDVAAVATTAAGIEYPGLIAMAQRLYRDPERQVSFESATVHEVAHQWWYNVVGNDQINDPWLDEALAQYSTYLYYRSAYGAPGGSGFLEAMDERWARVDRAEKPIGLPVGEYVDREYGAIVYGRGALFFVALAERIGNEKMLDLLQRYYREQAWEIATPAEFKALAEEVAGERLDDLFDAWVYPKR